MLRRKLNRTDCYRHGAKRIVIRISAQKISERKGKRWSRETKTQHIVAAIVKLILLRLAMALQHALLTQFAPSRTGCQVQGKTNCMQTAKYREIRLTLQTLQRTFPVKQLSLWYSNCRPWWKSLQRCTQGSLHLVTVYNLTFNANIQCKQVCMTVPDARVGVSGWQSNLAEIGCFLHLEPSRLAPSFTRHFHHVSSLLNGNTWWV